MRSFQIIAAIILALIVFAVLKLLGFLIKFALIAAVFGFVAGLLVSRLFIRR